MTGDKQPEYAWDFSTERPKRNRLWLIIVLAIAAVAIAALVFWLFLRPGGATPESTASPTASPSTSPSPSLTSPPSATTATPSPEPSMTPVTTPPPAPDPSLDAFRGQVEAWLTDADTGLDIIADSSGQEAIQALDLLRDDAQRLAGTPAPSSIASEWNDSVAAYGQRLADLRAEVESGRSDLSVEPAQSAVRSLRELVGL